MIGSDLNIWLGWKGHQSRGWLRLTELEWRLHLDPPHLDILPGGGPGHQGPAAVPLTHKAHREVSKIGNFRIDAFSVQMFPCLSSPRHTDQAGVQACG